MPTTLPGDPTDYDNIVLVGGLLNGKSHLSAEQERFLLRAAREDVRITGLCTGSFVLARYGLLDSHRACVSWFHIAEFKRSFPQVRAFADSLFVIDRNRATCAGGTGAADLAADFVSRFIGDRPAEKAAKILVLDRIRKASDVQPVNDLFPGASSIPVKRALLLMESSIQERKTISSIIKQVDCSRRNLERLFSQEIGVSPQNAYMALRLDRAKSLLRNSDLGIPDIGYECGFVNAGHFSRAFRKHLGVSPSQLRKSGGVPNAMASR